MRRLSANDLNKGEPSAPRIAQALLRARAGAEVSEPGRGVFRLLAHGLVGWALCAATMVPFLWATSLTIGLVAHALVVATIFALVAWHYSRLPGAYDPLTAALTFAAMVALLNLAAAALVEPRPSPFESVFGFWSPVVLVFGVTGVVAEFAFKPRWASTE
jgi:hypothetical protein